MPLAEHEKKDIIRMTKFIQTLLDVLIRDLPSPDQIQFDRAWNGEVRERFSKLIADMEATPVTENKDNSAFWDPFMDLGLTGEQLRLKHDQMASHARSGAVDKTLHVVNVFLGSLQEAVLPEYKGAVHATGEIKGFIEPFFHRVLEPNPKIQTLFEGGSYRP